MASASAPNSDYLSKKTKDLEVQTPVDPSLARAAQIPLQSFSIPTFPPEAFTSGLTSLILTSDIKLNEYPALLEIPFDPVPDLPGSISSLTLELFALGYPAGFLKGLGEKLPNLKSLTLYSQLFAGTTAATREDALNFLRAQEGIQDFHLLDVFTPPGFFSELGGALKHVKGLKFLEINFAFRHSDPEFLTKTVPSGEDISNLLSNLGALVGLTCSMSEPDTGGDEVNDEDTEQTGKEVGVLVKGAAEGQKVVESLLAEKGVAGGLVVLDLTMFELSVRSLKNTLDGLGKVQVLALAVEVEDGWKEVLGALGKQERLVEVLEVVGVPGVGFVESLKSAEGKTLLTPEDLSVLSESWKGLKTVKASILRTKTEQWTREGDGWICQQ